MDTAIVNLSGNRSRLASDTNHLQPLLFLTVGSLWLLSSYINLVYNMTVYHITQGIAADTYS